MKIYFPSCLVLSKNLPIDLKNFTPLNEGLRIAFCHNTDKYRFSEYSSTVENAVFCKYGERLFKAFHCIANKLFSSQQIIIAFYDRNPSTRHLKYLSNPKISIFTNDQHLIENVFWDSLMYKSFPLFIDPCSRSVIVPTDHLDLFIASEGNLNLSELIDTQELMIMKWGK